MSRAVYWIILFLISVMIFTGLITIFGPPEEEWYKFVFYSVASIGGVVLFFKNVVEFANATGQFLDRLSLYLEKRKWIKTNKKYFKPIMVTLADWDSKGYPVDILQQHILMRLTDSSINEILRESYAEKIISDSERFKFIEKRGGRAYITNEGKEIAWQSKGRNGK